MKRIIIEIKRIANLLIAISLFVVGCESTTEPISPVIFELQLESEFDINGYYHITIDTTKWQTTHRITGYVHRDNEPVDVVKFAWGSSHYWYIGDTLGYIVKEGLTENLEYVAYDTSYVTWFNGFEVPVVNSASYSYSDGEVNTMMVIPKIMRGDTITVYYGYHDNWLYEEVYGEFYIVLD